jgi:hypothetical protein
MGSEVRMRGKWGNGEGTPNPTENQKSSESCLEYNENFMGYNKNSKEFKYGLRISKILRVPKE